MLSSTKPGNGLHSHSGMRVVGANRTAHTVMQAQGRWTRTFESRAKMGGNPKLGHKDIGIDKEEENPKAPAKGH